MRLLTNKVSSEWARRVMQDISMHAKHSCPAHCTTMSSADCNFDHSKPDYAFEVKFFLQHEETLKFDIR